MDEPRKITRSNNGMIAGVCAGFGEYLDVDPTIVRIVYILLVFFAGIGVLLYLILWLIIPKKGIR